MIDAAAIDALLPQTQCTRCGYPTCRAYAEAIAGGAAEINRCPPGGAATIAALADLTGQPILPLDPRCGREEAPQVARIDEERCIGCTKCIRACPVDAIVGAAKRMHSVLEVECTGCALCLPPCPVDCIRLVPSALVPDERDRPAHQRSLTARYRARHAARPAREVRREQLREAKRAEKRHELSRTEAQAAIAQALARARAKRQRSP